MLIVLEMLVDHKYFSFCITLYILVSNGDFQNLYIWFGNYKLLLQILTIIVTESINVSQPSDLFAFFNLTYVSCYGYNDGSIDGTITGGTPPYTYLGIPEILLKIYITSPLICIFFLTDSNNCFFTDTIVVFEPSER